MTLLFLILTSPFSLLYFVGALAFDLLRYFLNKYRIKVLRAKVKVKHSLLDNSFMTDLSLGVFTGSIIGLVVTTSSIETAIYAASTCASLVAMIDYNYKKKYNK